LRCVPQWGEWAHERRLVGAGNSVFPTEFPGHESQAVIDESGRRRCGVGRDGRRASASAGTGGMIGTCLQCRAGSFGQLGQNMKIGRASADGRADTSNTWGPWER